MTTVTQTRFK